MANIQDYSEFNLALDRLMRVSDMDFSQSIDNEPQAVDDTPCGMGSLLIQVTIANGALPVTGATVTITNKDGDVIAVRKTDNSGRITAVELPTPNARLSQAPNSALPYSTYNIQVKKRGFYTEEIRNVAVFDKIESIQPVSLEPIGENSTEDDKINIVDETAPMQQ